MTEHLTSPQAARPWCDTHRNKGLSIGYVATMGALHSGHIDLIERAQAQNDTVIVSIFVNPLQFNQAEDLANYPRDESRDIALLESVGVQAVFTGSAEEFLGDATTIDTIELPDPGIYALGLEGRHRPGHFAGVREVVSRLFSFVGPCRSYFGEKDYQQLRLIEQLAETLPGIDVIPCPTAREVSGLALSSRNARLSETGKTDAAILFRAMQAANMRWIQGERTPARLQNAMLALLSQGKIELEYAEVRDPLNWTQMQPERSLEQARVLVAGTIEGVRLIDNLALAA
jgi:pantoate--beta-alanine ligase